MKRLVRLTFLTCMVASAAGALAVERFPPPEFESGYELPSPTTPSPRSNTMKYVDLAVLAAALAVATYLTLKIRYRRAIFVLMLACLIYFGFYREGCVCAIGAIQNVSLAIFDGEYAIPLVVLGFFLLPLLFTLLFGRVFCAAVCPLGAIQDVVLLRPTKVPYWLEQALGLLPWVVLAATVGLAATGSVFLICEYDPLVGFFRLSASFGMLILGVCVLLVGVFIGRPYCRFICPLGAMMRPLAKVSRFRVTITPSECVQCRLCEEACPFGAIQKPNQPLSARQRPAWRRRLAMLIVLFPVLIVLGSLVVSRAAGPLSKMHYTVRLAERIGQEQSGQVAGTTDASDAFRKTGQPVEQLYAAADAKLTQFAWFGWIAGAFLGLVIAGKLIALSIHRSRSDYEANRARCLACGRCFEYCPIEKQRRKGNEPQIKQPT